MNSMNIIHRIFPSARAFAALRVLLACVLLPLAATAPAQAQGGREIVGGPITTARFERLLGLFVAPTTEEATALDRLHEQYLEKFRKEIEPEIAALSGDAGNGFPTKDRFERLLRDLDRVNARISDADNAFFSAAGEIVAEPRRSGIARLKAARERQRLLAGVSKWVPMSFGQGATFVDIADMLARDRFARQVPPEAREQFNAFLAAQEPRLLTQARTLNNAAREGMGRLYDVSAGVMAVDAPAIPADASPEEQARIRTEAARRAGERMRSFAVAMEEIGRPVRKVLRANHIDNRTACAQLAPILGRVVTDEFRELSATRALGGEAYAFGMSMGDNLALASIARRMRGDVGVNDDARARIDEALAAWRSARAAALEAFVMAADDTPSNALTSRFAGTGDAEDAAAAQAAAALEAARDDARDRLESADKRFQEKLLELLGTRWERYFEKVELDEVEGAAGDEPTLGFMPRVDELSEEEERQADLEMGQGQGIEFGYSQPIAKTDMLAAFKLAGAEVTMDLADATYESWLADKWNAKVGPLDEKYRTAQDESYEYEQEGGIKYRAQEFVKMAEAARAIVAAVADADDALSADLGGALGLAADSPSILLLRLAPIRRLSGAGEMDSDELEPHTPSVASILELGEATPAEVAAILAAAKAEWAALAAEVRPALAQLAALDEREGQLQMRSANRDVSAVKEYTARYEELGRERNALQRGIRDRLAAVYDAACTKAVTDPDRLDALRRARTRATFPAMYSPEQSAEKVLTGALAMRDIDDGLRAQIDALRAEYIAVFDKLSAQIVELSQKALAGASDNWTEYTRQMQAVDNLRFERDERTAKARSELRRLLGPERSARMPGLAEKEPTGEETLDPFEDED